MQIIAMPSFHPWTSWALYVDGRHDRDAFSSVLVTAIWRLDVDVEKFRDPVIRLQFPRVLDPTIDVTTSQTENAFLPSIVSEICELRVPVHPGATPISLDGTSYELTTGFGFAEATFRWHENSPASWQPLQNWVRHWIERLPLAGQRTAR